MHTGAAIEIRKCHTLEEYRACLELQRVIGAFDGPAMVGFALSVPGARAGHSYLHSHMLAVRQKYRNSGLGRKVKLFQREDALARGFELIEWTFDPLEIKNAYLNVERLGAIARRYTINQYGITSSPLQGGLPTDRLVAEWWLRSERVNGLLNDGTRPAFQTQRKIAVPAQIYAWKASAADRGRAAEDFLKSFSEGLAVLGYDRDPEGNGTFLLGSWDEKWSYATSS